MNDFRKDVADALARQGRTRRWLAQAVGIHPQSVTNYLNGDRALPHRTVERMFDALGLEVVEKQIKE